MACAVALIATILLPPAEFDRDYFGALHLLQMSPDEVHEYCSCGEPIIDRRILACALPLGERCVIILPKVEAGGVSQPQYDRMRRHEIGHCNGWTGQHDGARR